jgi:hypothetical protein
MGTTFNDVAGFDAAECLSAVPELERAHSAASKPATSLKVVPITAERQCRHEYHTQLTEAWRD